MKCLCCQLDISTVAAGGGSRLFFRAGLFVVGPDSVGAHPGPVCYKKGELLLTLFSEQNDTESLNLCRRKQ